MENLIFIAALAGSLLLALFTIGLVVTRLYNRATPEIALVRTGFGGQKVVMQGGVLKLPVLHEIMKVNMKTMRLEIARRDRDSLITKDKLRVDVQVAFFARVSPDIEAICSAAQALGAKTMDPEDLKNLVEPKFANALRSVAAQMTMSELQDKRTEFTKEVLNAVSEDLKKNGLELEAVSITALDQTSIEYFNEKNVFDAEGLTKITAETEARRKQRNDVVQTTEVQIRQRNLESEREKLSIQQAEEKARLEAQQQVAVMTATQKAAVAKNDADRERESREAKILADRAVEAAQIKKDEQIQIAQQEREIAIQNKSREQSAAKAEADLARADAMKAEQSVVTAELVAQAERAREIAVIESRKDAERDAVKLTVAADAERRAAEDRAEAVRIAATAESEAEKIRAEGVAAKYEAEATGQRKLNEAANALSEAQMALKKALATIEALPAIIAETVKPMEKIDGIKVIHVGGLNGSGGGGAVGDGAPAGFADQLVNSALRYRAQAPVVDSLLQDIGLNGGDVSSVGALLAQAAGERKLLPAAGDKK